MKRIPAVATVLVCIQSLCMAVPDAAGQDSPQEESVADTAGVAFVDTVTAHQDSLVNEEHPQDLVEGSGLWIVSRDRSLSMRIAGSIRLVGAFDVNGLTSEDAFDTYEIPVGDAVFDPRLFMNASQSRLNFIISKGDGLETEANLRIEADFRGGDKNQFRLRHAYGGFKNWVFGQTWSTFVNLAAVPLTVDLEGPNSAVIFRTPLVRFGTELSDEVVLRASFESPRVETDSDSLSYRVRGSGDLVASIRYSEGWGQIQLSTTLRDIAVIRDGEETQTLIGYGLGVSGALHLNDKTRMLFQTVLGDGIARYINVLSGRGLDVVSDPTGEHTDTLPVIGSYFTLAHNWNERAQSTLTGGLTAVDNHRFQPDDAFKNSLYTSATFFYRLDKGVRLGAEYTWGRRENKDSEVGIASRLSTAAYFDF